MFFNNNITFKMEIEQYVCTEYSKNNRELTFYFSSREKLSEKICPKCGSAMHVYGNASTSLKDMPYYFGCSQYIEVQYHRYRCPNCSETKTERIPFKYKNKRITINAANWVKNLLKYHLSVSDVSSITGINWNTVRDIQHEYIKEALAKREEEIKNSGYKPKFLAVDEFSIQKGHKYATCVLDLETSEVIWVGEGRNIEAFDKFFQAVGLDFLSEVQAVAMDMNASYNKLVSKYLPRGVIVYDRYHFQSQYGKEVLGRVRLDGVRAYHSEAKALDKELSAEKDVATRKALRTEKKLYQKKSQTLKKARWVLLTDSRKLSDNVTDKLNSILEEHSDLAVCYALKEEMCRLFELTDPNLAISRWNDWFTAALESGIPHLRAFAKRKKERLAGLVSHAIFQISTGPLEGLNNKIKVAKRIGYGFTNLEYFFDLIRFSTLTGTKNKSHIIL